MVGYKNEKYLYLGRISARADDVLNFLPSRLAACLLILAAKLLKHDHNKAITLWSTEGGHHSSPNSGQTEAAMAGALNIFLGGTYSYQGVIFPKPRLHEEGREATYGDVLAAEDMVKVGTVLSLTLAIIVEAVIIVASGGHSFFWGL
jgi:adenosylcobinamide-phosphate synthase